MRFLADESCDARIISALRRIGHDVVAIAESSPAASDSDVLSRSRNERRILITEDRDFGQLVFASGLSAEAGILFLRCPETAREGLPETIVSLVQRRGGELPGAFAVWSPRRFRVRPLGES